MEGGPGTDDAFLGLFSTREKADAYVTRARAVLARRDAGALARRVWVPSGSVIAVYHSRDLGVDPLAGKFTTVCEKHGTMAGSSSLGRAKAAMEYPEFCGECMSGKASRDYTFKGSADLGYLDAKSAPNNRAGYYWWPEGARQAMRGPFPSEAAALGGAVRAGYN